MDSRLKVLAVLPFVIIAASLILINRIDMGHLVIKTDQQKLLNFPVEESEMEIQKPEPVINYSSVKHANLFYPESNGKDAGMVSSKKAHSVPDQSDNKPLQKENLQSIQPRYDAYVNPKLTFVVLNGDRSIAIMGERVLHEGDSVMGMTIQRIEKGRVLVKDKTLRWIYMEEEK